jgi:hypothetical protein
MLDRKRTYKNGYRRECGQKVPECGDGYRVVTV